MRTALVSAAILFIGLYTKANNMSTVVEIPILLVVLMILGLLAAIFQDIKELFS